MKYHNNQNLLLSAEKVLLPLEKSGRLSFSYADLVSNRYSVFPGFVDVHTHLREPGFSYKETISSGTNAAAHGGYTAILAMPNLSPVPDCLENLAVELEEIKKQAQIPVYPYGAITKGESGETLSDMEQLAPFVAAFSDDGKGVQNPKIMLEAMRKAKKLNKIIAAHCEDNSLLHGGYIHDGDYARRHGHKGISGESEWRQIERDIALVRESGCAYHVCHISTKESVELMRSAKAEGLDITCETAPHYLLLDETDLEEDGRFKMNPPLRTRLDRLALLDALQDGTIDMIATDHAPHSEEEKSRGLSGSLMGIVGLETTFPLLYTNLVEKGVLPLEKLISLMSEQPRKRFGIPDCNQSFCIWDLEAHYTIQPDQFLSKGKSTPFSGRSVKGKCLLTVSGGEIKYQNMQGE